MWSWLMVHMRKRIISPGVFLYFFQILIFRINSGAKQQKMAWNYVRESTPYLSKHTSFDRVFCCTSLKWWHQAFAWRVCDSPCAHCHPRKSRKMRSTQRSSCMGWYCPRQILITSSRINVKPIIVNSLFIFTRPHHKNLPKNAAWKLIIWEWRKIFADCSRLNPSARGEHLTILLS